MPKFAAAPALLEEDLVLPIPGADGVVRDYTIKAGTAAELLTLQALDHQVRNGGPSRFKMSPDDQARVNAIGSFDDYWGIALGVDVVRQMTADGVSATYFRLASVTASTWRLSNGDEEAALAVWSGKAQKTTDLQPGPETTEGSTPKEPTGDEDGSTKQPDSGSTTSTPTDTSSDPAQQDSPPDTAGETSGTAST